MRLRAARPRLPAWVPHVAASAYRRFVLHRVVFIGVTGSCGKTTTKDLIAAALSATFRGTKSTGTANVPDDVARFILRSRPWQTFHVQEIAGIG